MVAEKEDVQKYLKLVNTNYFAPFDIVTDDYSRLGEFDFIHSNCVLEHVYSENLIKFPDILNKLSRGVQCHFVGFKDHGNTEPYESFKYSLSHDLVFRKTLYGNYINRLRISDIKNLFNGETIYEAYSDTSLLPETIHSDFQKYNNKDLCSDGLGFIVVNK